MSEGVLHTVIDGTGICVSTVWRQSSAMVCSPPWYYETMAFKEGLNRILVQLPSSYGLVQAAKAHAGLVVSLTREYGGEREPHEEVDDA